MDGSIFRKNLVMSVLVLMALLTGCEAASSNAMNDPSERIEFELPNGWTEAAGSGGTRFSPPASPGVQVQVNTVDDNGRASLAQRRDAWLDFQRENGARVLLEQEWPGDNMMGVEYAHEAETATGGSIFHHVLLAGDGFVVATYLQVGKNAYEEFLPIYRDIVASIQAVEE